MISPISLFLLWQDEQAEEAQTEPAKGLPKWILYLLALIILYLILRKAK